MYFRFWVADFGFPIIGRCLGDARDACEVEILRDDGAPAVGAKFDVSHPQRLPQDFSHAKRAVTAVVFYGASLTRKKRFGNVAVLVN